MNIQFLKQLTPTTILYFSYIYYKIIYIIVDQVL
jgi:hypothetical protein